MGSWGEERILSAHLISAALGSTWRTLGGCTHLVLRFRARSGKRNFPLLILWHLLDLSLLDCGCGIWGFGIIGKISSWKGGQAQLPRAVGIPIPGSVQRDVDVALGHGLGMNIKVWAQSQSSFPALMVPWFCNTLGAAQQVQLWELLSEALSHFCTHRFGAKPPVLLHWWELKSH